jgi:NAD(P)-dependent dehydrogenase (short-subunit alcohol dehydrogenase family)
MDLELKGKKVIVSAATRGLGRRMVERFLDEGAIVSFCGRRARNGDTNPSDGEVYANPLVGDGVEEALAALSSRGTVFGSVVDCGYFDQVTAWVAQAAGGGADQLYPPVVAGLHEIRHPLQLRVPGPDLCR